MTLSVRWPLSIALSLLLLTGAASVANAEAAAEPAVPGAIVPDGAEHRRLADEALKAVETLRGVKLVRAVKRSVTPAAEIRRYLEERLRAEYPPDVVALEQTRYRRLGLIGPRQDLVSVLLDGMTGNIAGFYDPDGATLHVAAAVDGFAARSVVLHEWAHALQHERLDLPRLLRSVRGHGDYAAATVALLEGEATAVGAAAMAGLREADGDKLAGRLAPVAAMLERAPLSAPGAPKLPAAVEEELRYLYVGGLRATLWALRREGWAGFERWLAERPPLSSEQVLHPERAYGEQRDCPQLLTLPEDRVPGSAASDTMGEAGLRAFLRAHLDRAQADRAAAGWDGDRYAAVADGDAEPAFVSVSVWDTAEDAAEFETAMAAVRERVPVLAGAVVVRRGARVAVWSGDRTPAKGEVARLLGETAAREVCDYLAFEAHRRHPSRAGDRAKTGAQDDRSGGE